MTRDQEYTILPVRPRRNWLAISLVAMALALQLLTIGILTFRDTNTAVPAVKPSYSTPQVSFPAGVTPPTIPPTVSGD